MDVPWAVTRAHLRMIPRLQAEAALRQAEAVTLGGALRPELAEDILARWRAVIDPDGRARPKAPPIPRELLAAIGMGFEEVASDGQ